VTALASSRDQCSGQRVGTSCTSWPRFRVTSGHAAALHVEWACGHHVVPAIVRAAEANGPTVRTEVLW